MFVARAGQPCPLRSGISASAHLRKLYGQPPWKSAGLRRHGFPRAVRSRTDRVRFLGILTNLQHLQNLLYGPKGPEILPGSTYVCGNLFIQKECVTWCVTVCTTRYLCILGTTVCSHSHSMGTSFMMLGTRKQQQQNLLSMKKCVCACGCIYLCVCICILCICVCVCGSLNKNNARQKYMCLCAHTRRDCL